MIDPSTPGSCHPFLAAKNGGICPICPPNPYAHLDVAELRRLVTAEKCRRSLAEFFRQSWKVLEPDTPLLWNWHLEVVCDHVQTMITDWAKKTEDPDYQMHAQNLAINVPPGTAKSRILSVAAPAWAWTRWPSFRVLCLSANPEVAMRDSVYCRQLIESNWYQETFRPQWSFREDQNAKGKFTTTAGGERTAKGATAKIVGVRAHAIFADDLNDPKDDSDIKRKAVTREWSSAIYNRVNDARSAIRISIQQRVHELDFTGYVLAQGNWAHLCLPMEYEITKGCKCKSCRSETNEFGFHDPRTEEGEVLHKERFPREVLDDFRVSLGSYGYSGQFQQRPDPAIGGMFRRKHWRWYRTGMLGRPQHCNADPAVNLPERFDHEFLSLDANFKRTEDGSRAALLHVGVVGANFYILGNWTKSISFTEALNLLQRVRADNPNVIRTLIEDKANGTAILDTLRSKISGLIAIEPKGGKEARAWAMQPVQEAGNIYLPEGADWVEPFVGEFAVFPNGAHDDQVDALSQGVIYFLQSPDAVRARMMNSW